MSSNQFNDDLSEVLYKIQQLKLASGLRASKTEKYGQLACRGGSLRGITPTLRLISRIFPGLRLWIQMSTITGSCKLSLEVTHSISRSFLPTLIEIVTPPFDKYNSLFTLLYSF
mgnify:CR=1 FL=1